MEGCEKSVGVVGCEKSAGMVGFVTIGEVASCVKSVGGEVGSETSGEGCETFVVVVGSVTKAEAE